MNGWAMNDEQPRYFTGLDLMREAFHVGLIAVGCYAGWKIGESCLALFAGGVVGRIVGVTMHLGIRSLVSRDSPRDPNHSSTTNT